MSERYDEMNGRYDEMTGRIDDMSERYDEMNGRYDEMNGRIEDMDRRIQNMDNIIPTFITRMNAMGARIDSWSEITDILSNKIDREIATMQNTIDSMLETDSMYEA